MRDPEFSGFVLVSFSIGLKSHQRQMTAMSKEKEQNKEINGLKATFNQMN